MQSVVILSMSMPRDHVTDVKIMDLTRRWPTSSHVVLLLKKSSLSDYISIYLHTVDHLFYLAN